jgi:hypothetical protein
MYLFSYLEYYKEANRFSGLAVVVDSIKNELNKLVQAAKNIVAS